ncbi:MAG: ribosome biogenesis GTPase Der [Planctomycetes bacterium]|nr:ribosome biogenesis GTPase Der [Planctomycetota bacterium]
MVFPPIPVTLPRVAIVGRPNVGKSSLFNRLVGRRISIVEPTAGVTRDRVAASVEHADRRFELVDTGGLGLVDEVLLKEHVEAQIQMALDTADVVVFVVDGKEGRVPGDDLVARRLRGLGKPILLVANKVESFTDEMVATEWVRLGFGEPLPVSAKEGFGISDLQDRMVAALPPAAASEREPEGDVLRFAVVGKRNSGKSTLINQLAGEQRVIVSELPGTTRDAVDVLFDFDGRKLLAIDTAGVRKKKSLEHAIELFAHARSNDSIRRAHVVLHLFDVREPISQVDKAIAAYCVEHHKPVVLVGNKIDLAPELDLQKWDAYLKQQLPGLDHAPVSFVSAKDGLNVPDTLELLFELRAQTRTEMSTGKLNRVLTEARDRQLPSGRGHFPKMFYGTQIGTEPLSVMVFVNEPKLFRGQYERYLAQVLREQFACPEVPIRFVFRRREKVVLGDRG